VSLLAGVLGLEPRRWCKPTFANCSCRRRSV